MLLPDTRIASGYHLQQLLLPLHFLMVKGLRMNEPLQFEIPLFPYFFQIFLLSDLFISLFDNNHNLLSPLLVDHLNVKHFPGEHLRHVLHQTLEEFGTSETHIDTQFIPRVFLQVQRGTHRFQWVKPLFDSDKLGVAIYHAFRWIMALNWNQSLLLIFECSLLFILFIIFMR